MIENHIAIEILPLDTIVSLMRSEVQAVAMTALYTAGNICFYGSQSIIDLLLKTPLIPIIKEILGKSEVVEEMLLNGCLILRNLGCKASRTIEQLMIHDIYSSFPNLMFNQSISLNVIFIFKVG
jgi:hypothetical protein